MRALFLLFCFTAGRWLVFSAIRWVNDNFRSDFPVIKAITIYLAVFTMLLNLLVDVLYKWVDPRVEFK